LDVPDSSGLESWLRSPASCGRRRSSDYHSSSSTCHRRRIPARAETVRLRLFFAAVVLPGSSLPKKRDSRWERGRRSGGITPCPIHPHPGAVPRELLIPLFAAPGRLPWSNLPRKRAQDPPSLRRTLPLALRHRVKVQNAWLVLGRCRRPLDSPTRVFGGKTCPQTKQTCKRGFSGDGLSFSWADYLNLISP